MPVAPKKRGARALRRWRGVRRSDYPISDTAQIETLGIATPQHVVLVALAPPDPKLGAIASGRAESYVYQMQKKDDLSGSTYLTMGLALVVAIVGLGIAFLLMY